VAVKLIENNRDRITRGKIHIEAAGEGRAGAFLSQVDQDLPSCSELTRAQFNVLRDNARRLLRLCPLCAPQRKL
jgi:hypothetical protein